MTLIAGVDIGNSTTEIVIAEGSKPIASDRRPTRGYKGSNASIRAAAALLRKLERSAGVAVDRVNVAQWHPVTTQIATLNNPPPETGHIRVIDCANHSVAGNGTATGMPWNISTAPAGAGPVIAIVPAGTGYREAARKINQAVEAGLAVSGVIVADDEAVLIGARLARTLPVVDRADCRAALAANKLFMEVRPPGQCVHQATDVWALQDVFMLDGEESESLNRVVRWVRDLRAVIVGLFDESLDRTPESNASLTWRGGGSLDLIEAIPLLGQRDVGSVCALNLGKSIGVSDAWGVDIDTVLAERGIRGSGRASRIALASLCATGSVPRADLDAIFEVPVTVIGSESEAASIGARTTPGLPPEALILDIGGGTIDLVGAQTGITAAGGGELLSVVVAEVLDIPRGAADWVKRGPAQRVESAQVLLSENGSHDFLCVDDPPLPANAPGMLVRPGPVGMLAFGRNLQPAEWRIIRQSLKLETIARNVSRILQTYRKQSDADGPFDILIVGGPAEDDELLPVLGRLPEVNGLGRGNVAGSLGHLFAVAYGLTQV